MCLSLSVEWISEFRIRHLMNLPTQIDILGLKYSYKHITLALYLLSDSLASPVPTTSLLVKATLFDKVSHEERI